MALANTIAALAAIKADIRDALTGKHADPGAHFADYAGIIRKWWYPNPSLVEETSAGDFEAIIEPTSDNTTITFRFSQTVSEGAEVNWGDGNIETLEGTGNINATHTYSAGAYKIILHKVSGDVAIRGGGTGVGGGCIENSSYLHYVFCGIHIGIGEYAFQFTSGGGTGLRIIVDMQGRTAIPNYGLATLSPEASFSLLRLETITSVGEGAFMNPTLKGLVDRYCAAATINEYAFRGNYLRETFELPSGVVTISSNAVSNNYALLSVELPSTVTSIGSYAFAGCSRLRDFVCKATTPPNLGWNAFNNCNSLTVIKVPSASVAAYQAATNWSAYAGIIQSI